MSETNVIHIGVVQERNEANIRYVQTLNAIIAKWPGVINPSTLLVLLFITQRTYKYGKMDELIPMRHFMEGVFSKDGNCISVGTGLSKATFWRCIKTLQDYKLITVTGEGMGSLKPNTYAINFNSVINGPDMSKLCIPKKQKPKNFNSLKLRQAISQNETSLVSKRDVINTDTNKRIINNRNMVATGVATGASLQENIDQAVTRIRRKRSEKAKTATNGRTSLAAVKAVWEEAMLRHYPRVPAVPITRIDYAIFKKQYNVSRNVPIPEFLNWVVSNWKTVIGDKSLSWIAKKESAANLQLPNMIVMSRYFRYFVQLYAQREGSKTLHTMEHRQTALRTPSEGDGAAAPLQDKQELQRAKDRANRAEKAAARAIRELKRTREQQGGTVEIGGIDYSDFDIPEWGETNG